MLAVEPRRLRRTDEELRSVRSRAGIRHGEDSRTGVLLDEVLVGELGAVDGLAAGAVSGGEIAALAHELRDHAVEGGAFVVERLAALSDSFLAGAESSEILGGPRDDVGVELHDDPANRCAADGHVEEDLRVCHCCCRERIDCLIERKKKKTG